MSDNTEREAAQRYPDNPHLNYVPFYAQLKREGFAAGAEWQRAVDAEEIARLQAEVESWKSSNEKNLRYGEFVDDHFERVSAERDAMAQQIAAVRAWLVRDTHDLTALWNILANGACLWRYDDDSEEYQPHEFSDDNGNCCNCGVSPVEDDTPMHELTFPRVPKSVRRFTASLSPVTPESETN